MSLNTLWIYTALKHREDGTAEQHWFEYPLDLHCSQTLRHQRICRKAFEYPLDLHCSQTLICWYRNLCVFEYPLDLHCSQTSNLMFANQPCQTVV